jgi:hypothetical protein
MFALSPALLFRNDISQRLGSSRSEKDFSALLMAVSPP